MVRSLVTDAAIPVALHATVNAVLLHEIIKAFSTLKGEFTPIKLEESNENLR